MEHSPNYIISDNGRNLAKGIRIQGLKYHRDVSHTLGLFLENVYKKNLEFESFTKQMGLARLSYHLTKKAYLLPPNQRAICRFMNLFNWVEWVYKILKNFSNLTEEEQEAFSFVKENQSIIEELSKVMNCYRIVEGILKNEGLSMKTAIVCRKHVIMTLVSLKKY